VRASSAKPRQIRLGADAYHKLHQEILKRDGWRCQACGSLRGLEVHHIRRRSQLGDDSDGNLITLCSDCHRAVHARSGPLAPGEPIYDVDPVPD
jgi:5-methylcytosine-specific restriction endonuclease McrA